MSDPFIGEIRLFGGNFPPLGWAFCDGAIVPISENDALFALIGTIYGGDGQTTFALPDLRSRVPVQQGTGPGQTYVIGQPGGIENVTLTPQQLPGHSHSLTSVGAAGTSATGAATALLSDMGPSGTTKTFTYGAFNGATSVALNAATIAPTGGNQSHNNIQPSLATNFIISLFGIFPARN
jgi:microcystin-dependent protein